MVLDVDRDDSKGTGFTGAGSGGGDNGGGYFGMIFGSGGWSGAPSAHPCLMLFVFVTVFSLLTLCTITL